MSLNTEQGMDEAQQRKHALNGHRMKNALFSGSTTSMIPGFSFIVSSFVRNKRKISIIPAIASRR